MALANFGDLKTSIQSFLNRSDLTSYIPDFVKLAESRINYGSSDPLKSEPLRIPAMQARVTVTSPVTFPSDFLEVIRLTATSGSTTWKLTYADTGTFTDLSNSSDLPTVYTFLNNTIETAGTGVATFSLDYYSSFDALTLDADTNWLLTNSPQIYLFGALLESAPFISDMPMVTAWHGMYKSALNSLNLKAKSPGGGSMQVRAR